MKLAIIGVVTVALGAVLGVDGLLLAGVAWALLGAVLWALVTRKQDGDDPAPPILGFLLLFAVAAVSLAIGIAGVGFGQDPIWRWLPIGMGAVALLLAVVGLLARASPDAMVAAAERVGDAVLPAKVTIEGKRQTGTYVNEQPRIEFDLLVESEGLPSYRVTKKATVPFTALSDIAIGNGFEAKIVPDHEQRISIDWDSPVPADRAT